MTLSNYAKFFTPQAISLILCLHQVTKQPNQITSDNKLVTFLMYKILKIPELDTSTSQLFEAELYSITNDLNFVQRFRQILNNINSFNDFYRQISNILKTLRTLRSSKLQQGNLVDFLIRRMYIYFEKLDFKEIIAIFNNFIMFKENKIQQQAALNHHQFMLTKQIEQVKFNLENYTTYNPEQMNRIIRNMEQSDNTFKTSYLKGLLHAEEKMPVSSSDNMHKYFDKSLGNLFLQKIQNQGPNNKINHCILSMAYGSLQMGHLDQCLQSISEGLRISQNNSDEESINNCIIYLYKIAEQLGKYRQQILLAQHAITHSLNLNNLTLMLYSCLAYSYFEKYYDCQEPALMILKSRHISWTEALHFAKKKIYSSFQNNCKNIYHSHRNLLIPSFMHKLAILTHLPYLTPLLLNPYYQREQLIELQVYKQYNKESKLSSVLKQGYRYLALGQSYLIEQIKQNLQYFRKKAVSPLQIIKIDIFNNKINLLNGLQMEAYRGAEKIIIFCQKNGFIKQQYISQLNLINKILLKNQLYYDALVNVEQSLRLSLQYKIRNQKLLSLLIKAEVYIHLDHLDYPLEILRDIEQEGILENTDNLHEFYRIKQMLNHRILDNIDRSQFPQQYQTLLKNELQCFEKMLEINIDVLNLKQVLDILSRITSFINLHTSYLYKFDCVKKTFLYTQKVSKEYAQIKYKTSNDELLSKKVGMKIKKLYFRE